MKFYILLLLLLYNRIGCTLTDMEFENDLIKLLTKLHEKRNIQDDGLINVRVNNIYDLREFIQSIGNSYKDILSSDENYRNNILELSKRLSDKLMSQKDDFTKVKQKLDFVVEKTNYIQSEINNRKADEMTVKSGYQVLRPEYEAQNEKLFNNIVNKGKIFNNASSDFNTFNAKLSELISDIEKRNRVKDDLEKVTGEVDKLSIEMKFDISITKESHAESKFLKAIAENIENDNKDIIAEQNKLEGHIEDLKCHLGRNTKGLDKIQTNEQYKLTTKQIKQLLTEQEDLEVEIKELMKNKNKIKTEINTKDIEHTLKVSNLKSEIGRKETEITQTKKSVIEHILNSKKNLLDTEAKIKNLILILNKLLLIHKPGTVNPISNLLFSDGKRLDFNDINNNLIEQISNFILKN
jgi:hypothetical protein